jgi:hypothetical protein
MDIIIQTGKIYNFKITNIENLNGLYNELTNSISENITKDNINASVKKLCDIFVDCAQTTFGTYKNKRKNLNRKPKGDKPWFNYECKFARKKLSET